MRKNWIVALSVVFLFCGLPAAFAAFEHGTGTADNPFIVTTAEQLNAVRGNMTAHYKLGNDIDLTAYLAPGGPGYDDWGTSGWLPIGSSSTYPADLRFRGRLDGGWHKITGLRINCRAACKNEPVKKKSARKIDPLWSV